MSDVQIEKVKKGKATSAENVNDWFEAHFRYYKSPEGEAEYKKIGLEYSKTLQDYHYMQFQKLTRFTKKEDHKKYISNMRRYILASGEEYVIHDMTETKYDPIGNRKTSNRSNIGVYGKPVPRYEIRVDPEQGYAKERYVAGIDTVDECYSIPFDKKHIDEL